MQRLFGCGAAARFFSRLPTDVSTRVANSHAQPRPNRPRVCCLPCAPEHNANRLHKRAPLPRSSTSRARSVPLWRPRFHRLAWFRRCTRPAPQNLWLRSAFGRARPRSLESARIWPS
jgi:hypothetical protein